MVFLQQVKSDIILLVMLLSNIREVKEEISYSKYSILSASAISKLFIEGLKAPVEEPADVKVSLICMLTVVIISPNSFLGGLAQGYPSLLLKDNMDDLGHVSLLYDLHSRHCYLS